MVKLLLVCLLSALVSYTAMALVKMFVVFVVAVFYGGHYQWGMDDVVFVLKQGTLMASIFCIFAMMRYFRNRK